MAPSLPIILLEKSKRLSLRLLWSFIPVSGIPFSLMLTIVLI